MLNVINLLLEKYLTKYLREHDIMDIFMSMLLYFYGYIFFPNKKVIFEVHKIEKPLTSCFLSDFYI